MIDEYCVTSITWKTIASRDAMGTPTYSAGTTITARVEYKEKLFKSTQTGERKVSNTQIYFNSSYGIVVGDRIIIDGVNYEVEMVSKHDMFETSDHKKAYLV